MPSNEKMKVVFCWHMHQPDYRDVMTGEYYFPWTYLHATKDYVDMVAHLEAHPKARVVFNFAPILLEQIAEYAEQINAYLHDDGEIKDALLAALAAEKLPVAGSDEFMALAQQCLRSNRERIIERFPAYAQLVDLFQQLETDPNLLSYLNQQFLADLLMWYHLGWMGETYRRDNARLQELQTKAYAFTLAERRELLGVIGAQLSSIAPRYRALAERNQIELAMSPYAHPILPLLLDIQSAREAMPDVILPEAESYPGGEQRAHWHLERGLATFANFFGQRPQGCWASEGALSNATLALLSDAKFTWTATGDSVLHNSLQHEENQIAGAVLSESGCLHRAYQFADSPIQCFFRDDGLSDLIGFKYATWHADDAVGDLINHMESIAEACGNCDDSVISIIMDGENAWEYFPENAYYFLDALYARLSDHPTLEMSTYSDVIAQQKATPFQLPHMVAGSWVYGSFSTWIGDQDKNHGWDMLCAAKRAFDKVLASKHHSAEQLELLNKQLALCEGSDWFWWFGDYNPAQSVSDFEYLFRRHLLNLYNLMEVTPPEALSRSISLGSGAPASGGVMRQGHAQQAAS